jgi:hypothetical protein
MMKNNNMKLDFFCLLTLVLIVLKAEHLIHCGWLVVFLPLLFRVITIIP